MSAEHSLTISCQIPFPEPLMSGNTATYVAAGLGLIMVGTSVKQFWQHRQNPILWWAASMVKRRRMERNREKEEE